jgi:hypothetical protein
LEIVDEEVLKMVTDPTRAIRSDDGETTLNTDLMGALTELATCEPSVDAPYLTVTLDWQPQGDQPQMRASRRRFADEADALLKGLKAHTPEHDSLSADIERITGYLDDEVDPSAHGIFIAACHAKGVFVPLALSMPLEFSMVTGPTPATTTLARLAEDHTTYAVLLADQHDAYLSLITTGVREGGVSLESTDYPRKNQTGGFSQRRFQNRVNERIEAFARDVAEQTRIALQEHRVGTLILAGDEVITTALNKAFPQEISDRIAGTIRLDIRATESEVIEATLPIVEQVERDREMNAVQTVEDNLGTGENAVSGVEDVLTALQTGQVMTLVMTDDFDASGWADYTLPVFGTGKMPKNHPAGGDTDSIIEVSLSNELVRLAVQFDAEIEIVHSNVPVDVADDGSIPQGGQDKPRAAAARALDDLGGVAAILRFPLAIDQTTAEM